MKESFPLAGLHNFIQGVDREIGKALFSFRSAIDEFNSRKLIKETSKLNSNLSLCNTVESRRAFYDSLVSNQMKPWLKNPAWVDAEPFIKVSKPDGYFCQFESEFIVGLPPGKVLGILSKPESVLRVFTNIKEIKVNQMIKDDGEIAHAYAVHALVLKFPWMSYSFDISLECIENRKLNRMELKLLKPGFMKKFYIKWEIFPLPEKKMKEKRRKEIKGSKRNRKMESISFLSIDSTPSSSSSSSSPLSATSPLSSSSSSSSSSSPLSSFTSNMNKKKSSLKSFSQNSFRYLFRTHSKKEKTKPSSHVPESKEYEKGEEEKEEEEKDIDGERIASIVMYKQVYASCLSPPFFLKKYVINLSADVSKQLLRNLQIEAKRIRHEERRNEG